MDTNFKQARLLNMRTELASMRAHYSAPAAQGVEREDDRQQQQSDGEHRETQSDALEPA